MLALRGCDRGRRGGQVRKVGERRGEGRKVLRRSRREQPGLLGTEGAALTEAVLALALPAVVRKLNELYKASVVSCQGLSLRLRRFFLDKQRLLDRIQSVTAEKLIFSHAVQTVGPRVGQEGRHLPGSRPGSPRQRSPLGSPGPRLQGLGA